MKKFIGLLMCICICMVCFPNAAVAKEKRYNSRMEQLENTTYVTSNVNQ